MAELGRAALVVTLGLALYALVAGAYAARSRPAPARRLGAQRAHRLASARPLVAVGRARRRASSATTSRSPTSPAHSSRDAAAAVQALRVLGRPGGLAAPLAARPDRRTARSRSRFEPAARRATSSSGSCRCSAGSRSFFAWLARRGLEPVRHDRGAARRARAQPEPAEPVHGRPTRRCSTSATSGSRCRSRSRWARCSPAAPTSAGSSPRAAGRSSPGRSLGVGQLLGAHWAYEEVGWGGYYAWDPVENAALMPWLAATAFLHSVMIQEKQRDAEGLERGARRRSRSASRSSARS